MSTPLHAVQKVLADLGLNDKEIKIYLALLTVGTSPASTLGDRTDIQRSTAQYTCQQLEKKGIIRMSQKGNTYLYTPEQPEKLLLLLEKKRRELTRKEEEVHGIIGSLKGLMNPYTVLPRVRYFEGAEGILEGYTMVIDSAQEGDEILSYLHALDEISDNYGLTKGFQTITKKMESKKIRNRILSPDSDNARLWKAQDNPPLRQTRFLKTPPTFNPTEIMLTGHTLYAIAVEQNQIFGFLAENQSIVSMLRMSFELLWDATDA